MSRIPAVALLLASLVARTAFAEAPHIGSISPVQGPIAGGTVVTIAGSGFVEGTAVRFNRTTGLNVRILSSSQIQVTTPRLGEGPFATALAAVRVSKERSRATAG